jgi:hypothetical protein
MVVICTSIITLNIANKRTAAAYQLAASDGYTVEFSSFQIIFPALSTPNPLEIRRR